MQTRLDKWDRRFLAQAKHIAGWSKDPSTRVGCFIADSLHRQVGMGYNGFPRGVNDSDERLANRELKYKLTQHAERNAIADAACDLTGCTAYVWPQPPCIQCTGGLIQANIARIVAPPFNDSHTKVWVDEYNLLLEICAEVGIITDFENFE